MHKLLKQLLPVICIFAGLLVLLITLLVLGGTDGEQASAGIPQDYENRIFTTDQVHTVHIQLNDWEGFLKSCADEAYTDCTVVIDGEEFRNVGLRAKGNSSLTTVAQMGSSRYSLKLEFDHYNNSLSYHGLDKLNLNNLIQDNTMMKDYLSYQLMDQMGVPAPRCSYVNVSVNGQPLGLYLAVEAIEESFLKRNYGNDYGKLYKPDADGGNEPREPQPSQEGQRPSSPQEEQQPRLQGEELRQALEQQRIPTDRLGVTDWDAVTPESLPELLSQLPGVDVQALLQALMAGATANRDGDHLRDVKLQYIDNDPNSYPNIFDNAKTDIVPADKARLIRSLKHLQDRTDLKNTLEVDEVIRYFAVHTFLCNEDSYTGSTVHNYYLYEKDGKLSMLPWDYNLSFGGMPSKNASTVINSSVFSPVADGDNADRPMFAWIMEDESNPRLYRQYHSQLQQIDLDALVADTASMIDLYVQEDPTKFCSYEEFRTGVDTLRQFLVLRSESIQQQLNGEAASVDVGNLNLSDMGGVSSAAAPAKEPSAGSP